MSSVHVYAKNSNNKSMLYTLHIPWICTHLDIYSPKLMVFHIEWETPGTNNPAIQIWLELYCLEGVNVDSVPVRDNACLHNSVECCCTPGSWQVRSGWHIKLLNIVVCNPLSWFLEKKLQHGMASTVHILKRRMLSSWIGVLSWYPEKSLLQEQNL